MLAGDARARAVGIKNPNSLTGIETEVLPLRDRLRLQASKTPTP